LRHCIIDARARYRAAARHLRNTDVEDLNKYIIKRNCASSWSPTRILWMVLRSCPIVLLERLRMIKAVQGLPYYNQRSLRHHISEVLAVRVKWNANKPTLL